MLNNDDHILSEIKNGNELAFQELYNKYWKVLAAYIFRITKESKDTEDILQEIFLSIWRRRDVIDIKGSVIAYLTKAAKNLSIRYIERNITKENFLESLSHFTQNIPVSTLNELEINELEQIITTAINALPEKMREIFLLSRMENLSYKEIAYKLEITENTVRKQVSNALKLVRTRLKQEDLKNPLLIFYFISYFLKK